MIFERTFLMRLANDLAVILKSQLKRVMGFQIFRRLAGLFVLGTRVISRLFCVIDKYLFAMIVTVEGVIDFIRNQ